MALTRVERKIREVEGERGNIKAFCAVLSGVNLGFLIRFAHFAVIARKSAGFSWQSKPRESKRQIKRNDRQANQ